MPASAAAPKTRLDAAHNLFGSWRETVRHQPARAFRYPKSHHDDDKSDAGANQECEPPTKRRIDEVRIEQNDGTSGSHRRAQPKTAVDREISPTAKTRGNELLDGRVDGRVFSANAGARNETEE